METTKTTQRRATATRAAPAKAVDAAPLKLLQQPETTSISAQLYRHLRGAIIRGELNPGQALSESEIARQYSTSRQPVREAFIKLAEERLVVIQPQRGTFVVKISVNDVLDARYVREAIEVAVVQEAAASAPLAAIRELRSLIEQQKAVAHGHNVEFLTLDEEFHRTLSIRRMQWQLRHQRAVWVC